jgi:hypothetical protein
MLHVSHLIIIDLNVTSEFEKIFKTNSVVYNFEF